MRSAGIQTRVCFLPCFTMRMQFEQSDDKVSREFSNWIFLFSLFSFILSFEISSQRTCRSLAPRISPHARTLDVLISNSPNWFRVEFWNFSKSETRERERERESVSCNWVVRKWLSIRSREAYNISCYTLDRMVTENNGSWRVISCKHGAYFPDCELHDIAITWLPSLSVLCVSCYRLSIQLRLYFAVNRTKFSMLPSLPRITPNDNNRKVLQNYKNL